MPKIALSLSFLVILLGCQSLVPKATILSSEQLGLWARCRPVLQGSLAVEIYLLNRDPKTWTIPLREIQVQNPRTDNTQLPLGEIYLNSKSIRGIQKFELLKSPLLKDDKTADDNLQLHSWEAVDIEFTLKSESFGDEGAKIKVFFLDLQNQSYSADFLCHS